MQSQRDHDCAKVVWPGMQRVMMRHQERSFKSLTALGMAIGIVIGATLMALVGNWTVLFGSVVTGVLSWAYWPRIQNIDEVNHRG